jgi:predicted nucleic acid-binding protein
VKLLADTSALLALMMRNDQYHREAAGFLKHNPRMRFILTDLILAEVITLVRARSDAPSAIAIADSLLHSARYEVIFVDPGLMSGALQQMARFSDKRLSLTDCASFETMNRLGLSSAFSFDRHFRECGFDMAP